MTSFITPYSNLGLTAEYPATGLNCRIPCHSKTHLESVAMWLRGYGATWLGSLATRLES